MRRKSKRSGGSCCRKGADWEKKTALEESADRLEKSREKLKDDPGVDGGTEAFHRRNPLFSEKVMEDFGQLQELMNELIDDELFELMQEMRKKFENDDRSGMEELMEDFSEKAKAFEKVLTACCRFSNGFSRNSVWRNWQNA
ncbi:MAG: hypothetical protein U5N26_11840 [Candidatus Marinimicrobia bacterium]|nr:hypothetical protein [Candidatus Neomarinimicrobiota bacterium]